MAPGCARRNRCRAVDTGPVLRYLICFFLTMNLLDPAPSGSGDVGLGSGDVAVPGPDARTVADPSANEALVASGSGTEAVAAPIDDQAGLDTMAVPGADEALDVAALAAPIVS